MPNNTSTVALLSDISSANHGPRVRTDILFLTVPLFIVLTCIHAAEPRLPWRIYFVLCFVEN